MSGRFSFPHIYQESVGLLPSLKTLPTQLTLSNPYSLSEILAVTDPSAPNGSYDYPWEVKFRVNQDDVTNYIAAADYINASQLKLFVCSTSLGLYGGQDGEYILEFLKRLKKESCYNSSYNYGAS